MDLVYDPAFSVDDAPDEVAPPRRAPMAIAMPAPTPDRVAYAPARNRWSIALIVLLHALALVALAKLDIVGLRRVAPKPMTVTMVAIEPPPPEHAPPPPPSTMPVPTIVPQIVAPPPLVAAIAPPAPVAVSPPPPSPTPAPAVAGPAPSSAPPAPVVADLMADVLSGDPPRYPTESRRLREAGTVRLRLVIGESGAVEDISVAQSSGLDRLDRAALSAVRRWRFRPSMRGGAAISATGYLPITFSLPH